MSGAFEHDSWLGGLNLFKKFGTSQLIKLGERPPYPVINSHPTFRQVHQNLNKADLGLVFLFGALGLPAARYLIKFIPSFQEYHRREFFNIFWTFSIGWGVIFGYSNSFQRLRGFTPNGLNWKRKERRMNKYDFTSEFEDQSIWKHFRLRQ